MCLSIIINAQSDSLAQSIRQQRKLRNKYLYTGLNRGMEYWQDQIASPLIYSGNVNGTVLGYEKRDNCMQARLEFTRATGKLFNRRTEKNRIECHPA